MTLLRVLPSANRTASAPRTMTFRGWRVAAAPRLAALAELDMESYTIQLPV
jgi:hypothetical protein